MDAQCISNTTRVCLKAMEKHFFLLKMIAAKIQLRDVSSFRPMVVVLVKEHRFKRFFNQSPPNKG